MMRNKQSEKEFFHHQIQLLYPTLFSEARAHTSSDQEAEDLVQITCEKAWESMHSLKARSKFRSWIRSIHRNVMMDYYRSMYREQGVLFFSDDPEEEMKKQLNSNTAAPAGFPITDEILEALIDRENRAVLMKAFQQLSDRHQKLLKMWLLSEYNQREIAEITGMNYNTLRTEIRRALIKLTALFHEIDGGYEDE